MKLIQCKAHFAKKHCKLTMAALVPFLLFGCSGGKTGKSDAGEKSKDVQVQTTGSEEQRKLAMAATAVPGVSVGAVFGADADKLMAFGLNELGKSADSLSLAGPVYKLSATAGKTPGTDGCFAILPVNSGSICFDEKISTTRFLIPSVVPGTTAAPMLGLGGGLTQYSSLDEDCLRALRAAGLPPDELCLFGRSTKRRTEYVAARNQPIPQPQPIAQTQVAGSQGTAPQAQSQTQTQERSVAMPAVYRKDPDFRAIRPLSEQAKLEEQDLPAVPKADFIRQREREKMATPGADSSSRPINETENVENQHLAVPRVQQDPNSLNRAAVHDDLKQEQQREQQQLFLAQAEAQERLKSPNQQGIVVPNQLTVPVETFTETKNLMPPGIEAEEIVSATVAANEAESPGTPMAVAPLPEVIPEAPPAEGPIDQTSGEGGGETEKSIMVPPPDCRTVMCAQVKVNPNCINPSFERVGCCDQFVGCAGGYLTPSCKTVGCPEGKECVEMCASCIPGPDGCPPNPCTSTCM